MSGVVAILLVEDENVVAMDIAATLEKLGYRIAGVAARGEDAVQIARAKRPNLVLMDIHLRGAMDGVEAAHQIQTGLSIPVVFLTAHSDDATLKRAGVTYPFGYLLKPFEDRELEAAIRTALYRHDMESNLRRSQAHLDSILASIRDAVVACDETGQITFVNRAAEELLGLSASEARGRRVEALLSVSQLENGSCVNVQGKNPIPVEVTRTDVQGSFGTGGQVIVLRDMTELRRAQKEHERALFERAARAAAEKEHERTKMLGKISLLVSRYFDRAEAERFQVVAECLVPFLADLCFIDVSNDQDAIQRMAVAQASVGDGTEHTAETAALIPFASEWGINRPPPERLESSIYIPEVSPSHLSEIAPSSEHRRILEKIAPRSLIIAPLIARGRVLGTLSLLQVRSGRRYEPADVLFAEELASRCGLAFDNVRLFRQAQEAIRVRDEFLSIAAHELKTPLTPLQLQIDVLEQRVKGETGMAGSIVTTLSSIRRQGERLTALVDQLLDVSRIMGGGVRIESEWVNLGESAQTVLGEFRGRTNAPHVDVLVSGALPVCGNWDRLRVEQILRNLLSNAFKYGRGKPVEVEINSDDRWAHLRVTDHGIGIAPADCVRIFDKFERAVSVRHYGGLGLGLFIARQSAEAMAGVLSVESEVNKGSTFRLRLPLIASSEATSNAANG